MKEIDRDGLSKIFDVYRALVELRANGAQRPPPATFRALAAELPGALRILDRMPLDTLVARAAELERALDGGEPAAWIPTTVTWRAVMRSALEVRREAGMPRSIDRARAALEARDVGADVSGDDLEAIMRPEGGRLVPWALMRVGSSRNESALEVEQAVFGSIHTR